MSFVHFRRHRRHKPYDTSNDIEVALPETSLGQNHAPAGDNAPQTGPRMTRSATVRLSATGHVRSFPPQQSLRKKRPNEDEDSDSQDSDAEPAVQAESLQAGNAYGLSVGRNTRSAFIEKLWESNWAGRGKKVDASADVLAHYHDSVLYAPMTFSTWSRAKLRSGWWRFWRNLLEFLVSVLALVLYIRWTYSQSLVPWYLVLNALVSAYFVVHYCVEFYSAPVRYFYIFSFTGIIDLLSILPIFWVFQHSSLNGFQIFRFMRVLRIQTVLKRLGVLGTSVVHAICILFINVFGIIFIFAALFQFVETRWPPEGSDCPAHGCIAFFTAFYYIIVTISTVGYGDITADTSWGRVVSIVCIFTAVIVIPVQLSGIITLYNSRPYGGNFSVAKVVGSRYIIIAGNLTYPTIQSFLAYLFHPGSTRDLAAFPLRVVLMAPFKPSFELKGLISLYAGFVEFIQGIPYFEEDLDRVGAKAASTIFLLPDQRVENRMDDDSQSFIRALVVSRFVGKRTRVICHVAEPESLYSPIWDGSHVEVLCPEELRMRLLARSCFVQGMSTFLTNLFSRAAHFRAPQKDWLAEYYHGALQQVFPVLLPKAVLGMRFEQAVELFYLHFGVTLFALDVVADGVDGERQVFLFPRCHVITSTDVGLVITATIQSAERVSKFGNLDASEQKKKIERENSCLCNCAWCIGVNKPRLRAEGAALQELQRSWADEGLESGRRSEPVLGHSHSHGESSKRLSSNDGGRLRQVELMRTVIDVPKENGGGEPKMCVLETETGCEQVAGLEQAVERLLAWPPISDYGRPTGAVIEKQEAKILANLKERTLTVVGQEKGPLILVCIPNSPPDGLYHFLAELRDDRCPFRNVAILHPTEPGATMWANAGLFEGVYFVKGSPMYELDLLRAGVLQADKVVVLSEDGYVQSGPDVAPEDGPPPLESRRFLSDVNNLVTVSAIERLPRANRYRLAAGDADPSEEPEWSGRVLAEMQREFTFLFMRPQSYFHPHKFDYMEHKRSARAPSQYALSYAEGKAWCCNMLECLVHATFSNKQTMNIMRQLVAGGDVDGLGENTDAEEDAPQEQRLLETIPVPDEYAGHEYRSLLVGLLHNQGYLALGLYRAWGTKSAPIGYVYTNPPGDTVVQKADLVYVLR